MTKRVFFSLLFLILFNVARATIISASGGEVSHSLFSNLGVNLLQKLGNSYGIDLKYGGFEKSYAFKLAQVDESALININIAFKSSKKDRSKNNMLYNLLNSTLYKRYLEIPADNQDYFMEGDDHIYPSEAAIWFFISGHASSISDTALVDEQTDVLIKLAKLAIFGKPFFPKQTVVELMEGALQKFNENLQPLLRDIGDAILRKQSEVSDQIPAEFFQFWAELCAFAEKYLDFDDILERPITLIRNEDYAVTLTNMIEGGGPLLYEQFLAMRGFIDAHLLADKSIAQLIGGESAVSPPSSTLNAEKEKEATMKYNIAVMDSDNFFTGFCKANVRADDHVLILDIGLRHINCTSVMQKYQFLIENFRMARKSVSLLISKHTLLFGGAVESSDEFEVYGEPWLTLPIPTEEYLSVKDTVIFDNDEELRHRTCGSS